MINFQARQNKTKQYAIGATVAVVMIAMWISLPLMSNSSLDSSVTAGNPFKSKVADIGLLGSDISSEGGAPGSPLSGEMIYNPATSGENIASSLFQSGPGGDEPADASAAAPASGAPASAGVSAPAPGGSASAGDPGLASAGKLRAAASITGGNSNSMTAGGLHNKFFGSGNNKAEFAPVAPADLKKPSVVDKKNALAAVLSDSAKKSELSAKTPSMDEARGGASAAFGSGGTGAKSMDLDGAAEQAAVLSGLKMGEAAQDLKKNDPNLNKTKVTPPTPKDVTNKDDEMKQQMKMMIIQMVLKMVLGAVFGAAA
ncbi:MAG: hypothetical protein M0025_09560 [Elusimicrobia bacterium]|nr:hypothetical protein [Elusimicrobiota bacterium]